MLAVAAATTQPDGVVLSDECSMASAARDCLDSEIKLDLFWHRHHVLIAVAELAALPSAPSVDVADRVDVCPHGLHHM